MMIIIMQLAMLLTRFDHGWYGAGANEQMAPCWCQFTKIASTLRQLTYEGSVCQDEAAD